MVPLMWSLSVRVSDTELTGYFKEVSQDFEDKLKILIQSYPYESTQRTPLLIQELGQISGVWKKIVYYDG